jgi:hypothetical protein
MPCRNSASCYRCEHATAGNRSINEPLPRHRAASASQPDRTRSWLAETLQQQRTTASACAPVPRASSPRWGPANASSWISFAPSVLFSALVWMCQLSLVLAELLTNTARHAFALGCRATLKPHLGRRNAAVTMIVVDDGVGLRPGFDPGPYGLRIVLARIFHQGSDQRPGEG